MDKHKQQYIDFKAYERVAEPHKRERALAWRTAIGLQDVDGLNVSDYLKETAVRHIEGDITIDDVREQLKSYYVNKTTHAEGDAEREEADRVAANIAKLLSEKSFSFTALEFLNIHRHLFEGVFKHAGEVRPYDISKKEWVLRGDSVRISLRWYRCSGRMVPRGAEPWYHSYRSDGTGTKCPLYTLSKGALQIVLQGTLS